MNEIVHRIKSQNAGTSDCTRDPPQPLDYVCTWPSESGKISGTYAFGGLSNKFQHFFVLHVGLYLAEVLTRAAAILLL